MKPAAFDYHRVSDVEEAVELLTELGPEAKVLAGGQSLVPMMNFRLARPSALVDIGRIPGLDYIRRSGDRLHIGALTTHRAVEVCRDPGLLDGFSVLARAARWIGHYPIRCRGTFGGSVAHGDSTAEWCLLAVLLDANVVLQGPAGRREMPASEFFLGFFSTAAEHSEVVVEVVFPRPAPQSALLEHSQRQGDFAVVAAAVDVDVEEGVCRSARIVLGGVDPLPVRMTDAEDSLVGTSLDEHARNEAGKLAAAACDPASDGHGSADYRRSLAAAMVSRALVDAVAHRG